MEYTLLKFGVSLGLILGIWSLRFCWLLDRNLKLRNEFLEFELGYGETFDDKNVQVKVTRK